MPEICVIFDLDGTLVDSEILCNQAFLDLLPDLRCTSDALMRRYRGKKLANILADIQFHLGCDLPDGFEGRYRQRVSELFRSQLKAMPGVLEMLDRLPFSTCIASSGPVAKIREALQVSGLANYFDERIFSSYEINSWKPEPALFQHAAKRMGFEARYCAVIEDSEVGIAAALSAHMQPFKYAPDGDVASSRHVSFQEMSVLPELLFKFAASAR